MRRGEDQKSQKMHEFAKHMERGTMDHAQLESIDPFTRLPTKALWLYRYLTLTMQ